MNGRLVSALPEGIAGDETGDGGCESMRRLVAVLGAAMLVAVSCSSGTTTGGGASPTAATTEKPQQGGRDIAAMQPVLVNDTASGRITALIYDNLIQVDSKTGEPQPRLATFSVSADSL